MTANIRHSSSECRWGTNAKIARIGWEALFPLDDFETSEARVTVDPFSEPEFNATIRASRILDGSPGRDGFRDRWIDRPEFPRADHILAELPLSPAPDGYHTFSAHVNPPGDELGEDVKKAWWILDWLHGHGWLARGAFYVGFTLNQLQTFQHPDWRSPLHEDFVRCIPSRREPFVRNKDAPTHKLNKRTGKMVEVDDAPSHPCFFLLMPARDPKLALAQVERFTEVASKIGEVF